MTAAIDLRGIQFALSAAFSLAEWTGGAGPGAGGLLGQAGSTCSPKVPNTPWLIFGFAPERAAASWLTDINPGMLLSCALLTKRDEHN